MSSTTTHKRHTIEDQREKAGLWFTEDQCPGIKTMVKLLAIHSTDSQKSKYQKIDVIETSFGRTLVTDGKTQSSECDEFIYHESLVQPAFFLRGILSSSSHASHDSHENEDHASLPSSSFVPETVFIGGGGELATAREVLRHSSVKRCIMVDLDEEVINVAKEHLPTWGNNATEDPRLELIIGDAHEYIQTSNETFDIIIMDISDPIEAGPGIMLYTQEFYREAQARLTKNGVFVTQAGNAEYCETHQGSFDSSYASITNTLGSVFDCAIPYNIFIPSFQSPWGFVIAFNLDEKQTKLTTKQTIDIVKNVPEDVIDEMIQTRIKGGADSLKHYDGECHRRLFAIVKSLKRKMAKDKRIMTKDDPVFMY